MKRALVLIALLACAASARAATDTIRVVSASAPNGTVYVPLLVTDFGATRLGVDQVAGQRIQAIGFRVRFAPASAVTSATFTRAATLAGLTPLYEQVLPFAGGLGYIASFAESTNPLRFFSGSNDQIGWLAVTLAPGVTPGSTIAVTFDPAHTALSNQAGTVTETFANAGLSPVNGGITVTSGTCPAQSPTISIQGRAGACSSGMGGIASIPAPASDGGYVGVQWGWRATPYGPTTLITGADFNIYGIDGADFGGGTGTRWLVATVTSSCTEVTSAPVAVTIGPPDVILSASTGVYANSTENYASVSDAGPSASYNWSITNGTITSGQGTRLIRYTAGASGAVSLDVAVTGISCGGTASPHADVTIMTRPAGASMLYLLTPCRVYDSRDSVAIANGEERPLTFAGACGVPAGAKAVTANIIVITPPTDGWLGAFPSDLPWPGTSTLNYRANRTRANNAVIPLSSDGRMTLKNSGSTLHFVIDVTGYFK